MPECARQCSSEFEKMGLQLHPNMFSEGRVEGRLFHTVGLKNLKLRQLVNVHTFAFVIGMCSTVCVELVSGCTSLTTRCAGYERVWLKSYLCRCCHSSLDMNWK